MEGRAGRPPAPDHSAVTALPQASKQPIGPGNGFTDQQPGAVRQAALAQATVGTIRRKRRKTGTGMIHHTDMDTSSDATPLSRFGRSDNQSSAVDYQASK